MSMFHVGQQVVCIRSAKNPAPRELVDAIPGCVYTVREVRIAGHHISGEPMLGLWLEEIVT